MHIFNSNFVTICTKISSLLENPLRSFQTFQYKELTNEALIQASILSACWWCSQFKQYVILHTFSVVKINAYSNNDVTLLYLENREKAFGIFV